MWLRTPSSRAPLAANRSASGTLRERPPHRQATGTVIDRLCHLLDHPEAKSGAVCPHAGARPRGGAGGALTGRVPGHSCLRSWLLSIGVRVRCWGCGRSCSRSCGLSSLGCVPGVRWGACGHHTFALAVPPSNTGAPRTHRNADERGGTPPRTPYDESLFHYIPIWLPVGALGPTAQICDA